MPQRKFKKTDRNEKNTFPVIIYNQFNNNRSK